MAHICGFHVEGSDVIRGEVVRRKLRLEVLNIQDGEFNTVLHWPTTILMDCVHDATKTEERCIVYSFTKKFCE